MRSEVWSRRKTSTGEFQTGLDLERPNQEDFWENGDLKGGDHPLFASSNVVAFTDFHVR